MRLRRAIVLLFICVIIFAGSALIVARRYAINAQCPRGLIFDRTKWPKYLSETIEPLERDGLVSEQIDGFRIHVWSNDRFGLRFPKNDSSTNRIVTAMSLTRVGEENNGVREFHHWMPQEWTIINSPTAEYYVSSPWLTGDEGPMYVLRVDSSDEFAYIYYYYNF